MNGFEPGSSVIWNQLWRNHCPISHMVTTLIFIQYLGEGLSKKFWIYFGIFCYKANFNCSKWPKVELMIYLSGRTEHGLIQIYSIELKKIVVPLNYFGLTIVHSCDLYIQCFFWTLRKYLLQLCLSKLLYKLLDCL